MARQTLDVPALYAALDRQRAAAGLSWRQVASETGVSPSTYSRMVYGKHPDADALCSIIVWLGLSLRQFVQSAPTTTPGGAT
jgi:transcriptional regulator with XRE-family HTH domain